MASNEDYAKRAVELGHGIISTAEHGWQGRYIEGYELAAKYNLKFVFGAEAYWVKDRSEKDRTNCHIYLGAKTEKGRRALNDTLAEANISGFYGQPRLDIPLLLSLPPEDVLVTTACVAYWRYDDIDDITLRLQDHFKENFFLEVQYHNFDIQRKVNAHILELSKQHNIPLIMGCDSHYIKPEDASERSDYIKSKGIDYPDEDGFILDYPDGDTAYQRFADQCVLSHEQILEAINNTNVFLQVEDYDCPCFTKDIKMPTLYHGWSQEQRDAEYDRVIWGAWDKEKQNVPKELWEHYEQEIQKEINIVHTTKHSDYFLLDKAVVERGRELGGVLTKTGRGSAVSFYTNKLLGLTDVDRISAKVKMYPERFMSPTRILEAKTLADVDLNVADRSPFLQAQKDVMGAECSEEMIAYGTLKPKAAWKMYAKSQNVDFELANEVSAQIERYEKAVKHAPEEEKDTIDVLDYIDDEYKDIYLQSGKYLGVVSHMTPHPCATLLYQGNIRQEIGLISVKGEICCVMDGKWAEDYKFLKNDWLKVSVVDLISRVYKRIGIPWHTEKELLELCPPDSPVWDMVYGRSCTLGINQVEQTGTAKRVSIYAPKSISELCAFVAAIRPGFKSMYKTFESRQHFEYGIDSLDELIQTPDMPHSFILYQEMSMAVLNYSGIPMSECYEIIKNIAKKRVAKVLSYKEQFLKGFKNVLIQNEGRNESEAEDISHKVWQILEDSSAYSFNACLSSDVVLKAPSRTHSKLSPTVGEMYHICNDIQYAKSTGHKPLHDKYRRNGFGTALSMYPDGKIKKNKIVGIYPSGKRQCYLVKTKNGHAIECTDNHKFPTPAGEKMLKDLKIGDVLYVDPGAKKRKYQYCFTDGNFEPNVPKEGERGFQPKPDGQCVKFYTSRNEHIKNQDCCVECGKKYDSQVRFELHHKDFDRTNNDDDNLTWLCVSCHKKAHYTHGRTKAYERGRMSENDEIISITPTCIQETYDVEMQDPAHTIISESGLVASNSHSYCVSEDSLYTAYLKTNYPLYFYEVFLTVLEEKGDKDRMNAVKTEAEEYFKISFPPYRFGQDNRSITADPENNAIQNSISAIKGFGKDIGDILYECSRAKHDSFISVLRWLDEHSIKAAKVEPLIKIDYFINFGNPVELKRILDIWDFFKQGAAKSIKKEKVAGTPLESILAKYATDKNAKGVELKSYSITDMDGLLSECEQYIKSLNLEDVQFKVKIANQMDVLGYVDLTTNKPEDRRKLLITDLTPLKGKDGSPWAYAVFTRSIGTGKTARLTLRAKQYSSKPFKKSDIIYAENLKKEKSGYWYLYDYDYVV